MAPRFLPVPESCFVTSGFGPRWGAYHFGLDFGRDGGSGGIAVHAAQGGTVQMSGPATGFGQWVVIDHPSSDGGGTTVYGHVLPEVPAGRRVEAGQRIATINPDQRTNGGVAPHLHFEVHRTVWASPGPDRLDPAPWLAGAQHPGHVAPPPAAPDAVLFGVDISNHQRDLDLGRVAAEGFVAVIAKASEGTSYVDPYFARNRDGARTHGLTFVGYHYVRAGDPAGNAACWDRAVGGDRSIPCMLDHEDGSGTLTDYWDCRRAIEALGYRVVLSYVPRWYHDGKMGGGDLGPVGPIMASSYGDDAPGAASTLYHQRGGRVRWSDYGGGTTAILQFTQRATVAGQQIDAWAYQGTRPQLDALLTGTITQDGPLMALTDDEQRRLLDQTDTIHRELTQRLPSRVDYQLIGEAPPDRDTGDTMLGVSLNADARGYESRQLVSRLLGEVAGLRAVLATLAAAVGTDVDADRIEQVITTAVHDAIATATVHVTVGTKEAP